MTDENLDETRTRTPSAEPATATTDAPAQYGVGPFTIREIALGGVWLVAFVVSFFPVNIVEGAPSVLLGGQNIWVSGLTWILPIGLPTVAVFLLALRRLSPQGIRRVGSLGIDQFASVAFSVAAVLWISWLWDTVAVAIELSLWTRSWVVWVEAVLLLAGVVLTVFAPLIPVLEQDFQERPESVAHRNARPVRAVTPRPAKARPAPAPAPTPVAPYADASAAHDTGDAPRYDTGAVAPRDDSAATSFDTAAEPASGDTALDDAVFDDTIARRQSADADETETSITDVFAPLHEQSETETADAPATGEQSAEGAQPATQAFWALAPEERDVVDEYGAPLFRVGPSAWALVIEDRGAAFVVRHEDGRIGFLHDVTGVTRG